MPIDPKKASREDIEKGLALLEKANVRKAKIASGEIKGGQTWAELDEPTKEKRRASGRKRLARQKVVIRKAIKAGITATEAEIEEELKG